MHYHWNLLELLKAGCAVENLDRKGQPFLPAYLLHETLFTVGKMRKIVFKKEKI